MRIPTPTSAAATEPEVEVQALDNVFRVQDISVPAGTPVKWVNKGINGHDVIPVDEAGGWGVPEGEFLPGGQYVFVFGAPGTYDYYCSLHGTTTAGMVGTVTVTGS